MNLKKELEEDFPIRGSNDVAILMHRDAHFAGNFEVMLDYYKSGKKGISLDFELEEILNLAAEEKESGKNLSSLLLSPTDFEKIEKCKTAYKKLRKLYENPSKDKKYALLIADLILAEEEEPVKEIEAIVSEKGALVPSLIQLLKAEEFYEDLMPGYGKAPLLAAKCLGMIGDKRAIISLFEMIGEGNFFDENVALDALKAIGDTAKEFLLTVLKSHPINFDNERAAIGLIAFKEDPKVGEACFKLLKEIGFKQNKILANYLILGCEHLDETPYKEEFLKMSEDLGIDKAFRLDILNLTKNW